MIKTRILIVEDESLVALDLKQRLEYKGYEIVAVCATGEDAVKKAASLRPELILMDVKLRGEMDGIAAAEVILQEQDIPIIYLTAYADEKTTARARGTGPLGYMLKPFDEREIEINIVMAIYKHSLEQRLRESEEKWRSLVASAPNLILILNEQGEIEFYNRPIFIDPKAREDPEKYHVYKYLSPASAETLRQAVAQIYHGEQPEHFEAEVILSNGKHIWMDVYPGPILIREQVKGVILIANDITDHIQIQEELSNTLNREKRANAFLSALGKVSAHVQQKADPDIVLDTLGSELKKMDLYCVVSLLKNQGGEIEIYYSSFDPKMSERLRQIMGRDLNGLTLSRDRWKYPEVYDEGNSRFITEAVAQITHNLPDLPANLLESLFGETKDQSPMAMALLPMRAVKRVIGELVIIGRNFDGKDMTALEIFANQVTTAFENARLFKQTQQIAITDPLTGIYNRRAFLEMCAREHERWTRYRHPYCLLMLDIDYFKRVNDRYGHLTGDEVLVATVHRVRHHLRKFDTLARFGGEEFMAILPETLLPEACQIAERLCQLLASNPVVHNENEINITASFGVTQVDNQTENLESLILRVDKALYQAKDAGRNCVRAI